MGIFLKNLGLLISRVKVVWPHYE